MFSQKQRLGKGFRALVHRAMRRADPFGALSAYCFATPAAASVFKSGGRGRRVRFASITRASERLAAVCVRILPSENVTTRNGSPLFGGT